MAPLLVSGVLAQKPSHRTKRTVTVPVEGERQSAVSSAEAALSKSDYAAAEPLLKDAVAKNAKDFRAWFDLGFLYNATGRQAEAIAAYRSSVAADPTVFESTLNLGLMLARAQDPEAEKYLRAATQLKPGSRPNESLAGAWLSLGHVIEGKDPASALAAYFEAARLQPRDPETHLSAGALLERQNQLDAALKQYQAAAELDPKSADAQVAVANIYMKSRRLPEAEAALRKYLALDPQNAPAQIQLGRVLAAENKADDAIAAIESAMKLAPSDPAGQRELASLYQSAGKFDKAEAAYRAFLQAEPNDASGHAALGYVLLHERKAPEAEKELLAAVRLDPRLGPAYGNLALAASENKNYALALQALDEHAKYVPDAPGTLFLRAGIYDNLRDYKRAAEYYRQFLAAANGRFPDEEWKARHRLIAIVPERK